MSLPTIRFHNIPVSFMFYSSVIDVNGKWCQILPIDEIARFLSRDHAVATDDSISAKNFQMK